MTSAQNTFDLWPAPSAPPSPLSPNRLPGATPESTKKLRELLKVNHADWHTFYDEVGRHNHISHHLLALWSMGASSDTLQAAYDLHSSLQAPKGDLKEPITKDNFLDHLGDRAYYKSYVDFFTNVVREKGGIGALEEFVFSDKASLPSATEDGKISEMLDRFHGGLLHPTIHVGYGAEFGLPGLAQAALNPATSHYLVPKMIFESDSDRKGLHALTILARVGKDDRFALKSLRDASPELGEAVPQYAVDWLPELHPSLELAQEKVRELEWASTVMYAIPGFKAGEEFNADFIGMHLVTSSLFLSSLVHALSPRSRALLLRTHLAQCLAVWARLGRPALDIAGFFAADTAHPNTLNTSLTPPSPAKFALPTPSSPVAVNPNPWFFILRQALVHPDDHVSKFVRTVYHYATKYGITPTGTFADTELEGADKLDGSLFVRAAGLSMNRLAREVEELPPHMTFWDRRTLRSEVKQDVY
ncbi:hypothetical protein V5O48_015133 [Marasmius crinis-equi]|uniref:Uncharacterized protein n=1 Tax=Marasmius crinis-equi TaxID=585013 RepID=A0ABR3EVE8_9AGAR